MYRYVAACCYPDPKEAVFCAHGDRYLSLMWERVGLPIPTIITVTRNGLCAQFLWELESPVTTSAKARRKPISYVLQIVEEIARRIGGIPVHDLTHRALA